MRADHGQPSAPGLQQVLGGALGALDVLGGHMIHRVGEDPFADQHQRIVHIQLGHVILPELQRAEDQPVEHGLLRTVQRLKLALARVQRGFHNHAHAQFLGLLDDQRRQLREVRHHQIRHGQADDARMPGAQVARRHVQRVSELVDRGHHLVPRARGHELVVVHHVRHGFDGHPRVLGHVTHRHGMIALLARHRFPPFRTLIHLQR